MDELREFARELETASAEDANAFAGIVRRGMAVLSLSETEIARRFDMSLPSVERWKNGRSVPHPSIRKHVYAFLLETAKLRDPRSS